MVRVVGVDIPDRKRLLISLQYIYGVGPSVAHEILTKLKFSETMRAHELTQDDIARLNNLIADKYVVEGDLRRTVQGNIKRLMSIKSYRGMRHRLKLPVRGQRTKTNSRTRKGPKKTVAGKKVAPR